MFSALLLLTHFIQAYYIYDCIASGKSDTSTNAIAYCHASQPSSRFLPNCSCMKLSLTHEWLTLMKCYLYGWGIHAKKIMGRFSSMRITSLRQFKLLSACFEPHNPNYVTMLV